MSDVRKPPPINFCATILIKNNMSHKENDKIVDNTIDWLMEKEKQYIINRTKYEIKCFNLIENAIKKAFEKEK